MFEAMHNFRSDDPKVVLPLKKSYYSHYVKELDQALKRVEELKLKLVEQPSEEIENKINRILEHMKELKVNITTLGDEIKQLESSIQNS